MIRQSVQESPGLTCVGLLLLVPLLNLKLETAADYALTVKR